MTRTVDELRDDVRVAVGRYERVESTAFTKEALAAVAEELGADVDTAGRLPPKAEMRAAILAAVDAGDADPDTPLRKSELRAVAAAVGADEANDDAD